MSGTDLAMAITVDVTGGGIALPTRSTAQWLPIDLDKVASGNLPVLLGEVVVQAGEPVITYRPVLASEGKKQADVPETFKTAPPASSPTDWRTLKPTELPALPMRPLKSVDP